MSNKSERIIAIVLSLSLAFAGLIFGIKAYADSENIEDSVKTSVVASSKVVVDSQGKIKSTTLDISNKLNTAVTVGSVSAPTELSAWVANIENNAVVDKGATLNKTWTPDSETIPASILSILTTGSGKTELNFNADIAYETWTVKWNSNGGNEPTQSETVIDGNSASLPASGPTRINYSFDSWNASADGNGKTITAEYLANNVIAADTEFFAKWAPQSFDIAYRLDEGRFPDGIDAPNSYTYGIGLSKLPQPVRDGYDFLGWFDSSEDGNEISEISSESSGGIELFAHWRLSTNTPYTVKHLKQNIDDDDYTLADTDNLAGTTGEKTKAVAKAYDGFTAQSFSQVDIASNGTSVVEIKYDRFKYNVTFNLMGEGSADEGDIETQRVKYEGKVVKPKDPTPTPDSGRKFGGWYPIEDYSGDAFNFETPVTEDINLYAKWMNENEAIYTVRHLQQNIVNDDYTVVSVDTETKTGNVGEKTQASAKTYEGFSSAKNFNQETITADGNTVVDIYYDRLTYIVVYDLQGRGDGVPDPLTVRYDGKLVKPSDPTSPAGYTFEGWVLKSQDTETAFDFASTTVKSGLRLYAKWSPVKYTVIFDKNSNSAIGNMPNQELTYDEFHNLYANTFTFSMNLFKGWSLSATGDVAYHDEQLVKNLVSTATSITLYAKWEATPEAFIAPSYIDPYQVLLGNISSKVITLDEVKTIATSLSKGEANPDQTIYNATNDAYHLFAKKGGTGENKDDWLECRIIHVGPHDGDGSGLTFQAIHALPDRYKWDETWTSGAIPNWGSCSLRTSMQEGGAIYSKLPNVLTDKINNVEKKYNVKANAGTNGGQLAISNDSLFILSMTENARNCAKTDYWNNSSYQGSTYKFWDNAGLEQGDQKKDSYQYKLVLSLCSTRANVLLLTPEKGDKSPLSATRSLANNKSGNILHITGNNAHVDGFDGNSINFPVSVVPAFAF